MDRRTGTFLVVGALVTLIVAAVISTFASSEPDGLERVAIDQGFADTAEDHTLGDLPLAEYAVDGIEDEKISTGIAGIVGVAITAAVTLGALYLVRSARRPKRG